MHAYRIHAQHVGDDLGERGLHIVARGAVLGDRRSGGVRFEQRGDGTAVQFAIRRQRKLLENRDAGGNHVVR